ncbi:haloacid dehalogenase [Anaerocolumna cellulosilytica]|uniref:Haloacid dehalogenase n=1 Tax=Anaerocolumna cellulosilytica TaxID=433286 RepID=A0A6S6QRM0_9FIRM|nr:HAD family phosphatase [Anaerocolumna cellulosilytica]MBB5196731.1 HAD superfamily hydrolase (TIGR01509 family) [Anaerocolumna cellulosilytica]BCJ93993.1 haloacid dehalogenase [Anaerocolumna cellulosilytica]
MKLKWDKKKYVIFDFDGTIADTNRLHRAAFLEIFKSLGIAEFEYELYMGRKTREVFKEFLQSKSVSKTEKEIIALTDRKQSLVRKRMTEEVEAYEGAIEFIRLLRDKGKILSVATSSSRIGVTLALKKLGIYNDFHFIITGDDVKKAKPSPEIYKNALQLANMKPQEAIVIEDSLSGSLAASGADIEVIIVNNKELRGQYYCTDFICLAEDFCEYLSDR